MAKGTLRSPMKGYEQQKNRRMPSIAGTTEMCDTPPKGTTPIQSPQTPFKISPNAGRRNEKKG